MTLVEADRVAAKLSELRELRELSARHKPRTRRPPAQRAALASVVAHTRCQRNGTPTRNAGDDSEYEYRQGLDTSTENQA
jgi:hypothetical protein